MSKRETGVLKLVELFHVCPPQFRCQFRVVDVVGGHGCVFFLRVLLLLFRETCRSAAREVFVPFHDGGVEGVVNLVEWVMVDVESVEVCC